MTQSLVGNSLKLIELCVSDAEQNEAEKRQYHGVLRSV